MGLISRIKETFGVSGPKLVIAYPDFKVHATDTHVPVDFTLIGGARAVHIDKIRVLLNLVGSKNSRHAQTVTDGRTRAAKTSYDLLYKQLVNTNRDKGWDLSAGQVLPLHFEIDFNNPITGTHVQELLEKEFHDSSTTDLRHQRLMNVVILADLKNVLIDPQDTLYLNVDLDPRAAEQLS